MSLACAGQAPKAYQYFRTGNAHDISSKTTPGYALMGGGTDLDAAFKWMCARSGGGDFLVIRATGDGAYNPDIAGWCHQNSVATLVIPTREAANDPAVARIMSQAEAIFISGGDQAHYIHAWKGTPVQEELNRAIARGVPIGGTSAGLAVQGEYIYSAQNDSEDGPDLSSDVALADPFAHQVVIVHGFLNDPLLRNTITDTHFDTRKRMGRSMVFMARILAGKQQTSIRAIGVDERTAVLLSVDGSSTVVGRGAAYFFQADRPPRLCVAGKPLTFRGIKVRKTPSGGHFNVKRWSGEGTRYEVRVENGVLQPVAPATSVY